jgi:hypothetical protein
MNSLQLSVSLSPFPDLRSCIKIVKAKRPLPAAATKKEKNKNVKWIKHSVFRKTRLIIIQYILYILYDVFRPLYFAIFRWQYYVHERENYFRTMSPLYKH